MRDTISRVSAKERQLVHFLGLLYSNEIHIGHTRKIVQFFGAAGNVPKRKAMRNVMKKRQ